MPRRRDDEDEDNDRPVRRRRYEEEDDDYDDDEPRPRRRREGDATGGLIPYKNGKALAAYYCAIFSLIPCIGGILGPLAVVLGFLGLGHAKKYPETRGQAHAIVGIVLGGLVTLGHILVVVLALTGALAR